MKSTTWSVYLEAHRPEEHPDRYDSALLTALSDALAASPDHRVPANTIVSGDETSYSVQLDVWGQSPSACLDYAIHLLNRAVRRADLPRWPVLKAEVRTAQLQEQELDQPALPQLVGVAEVSSLLGVSKQRVSALMLSNRFPEPITRLASGPVWLATTIASFRSQWQRKPGRPSAAQS